MERRVIPALGREVSWASLHLPPGSRWRGGREDLALLEMAVGAGVDLFGSASPGQAELLARGLFGGEPGLVLLSTLDRFDGPGLGEMAGPRLAKLGRQERRKGTDPALVPVVSSRFLTSGSGNDLMSQLEAARRDGDIPGWGIHVPAEGIESDQLREQVAAGAAVVVGDYSLLRRQPAERLLEVLVGTNARWIATDPFCDGHLDGSWLERSPLEQRPASGPERFGQLRASLAPVLALSFLTADRRRTLPEAALRFPLASPQVASVLCPFERPGILSTILSAELSPPFDANEREKLGIVPAA